MHLQGHGARSTCDGMHGCSIAALGKKDSGPETGAMKGSKTLLRAGDVHDRTDHVLAADRRPARAGRRGLCGGHGRCRGRSYATPMLSFSRAPSCLIRYYLPAASGECERMAKSPGYPGLRRSSAAGKIQPQPQRSPRSQHSPASSASPWRRSLAAPRPRRLRGGRFRLPVLRRAAARPPALP
jgi:hypothetical protein